MDLVEVAPDARPPVVRMMDYGKFKYDQSVKAREARKSQTRTVIKEVQFRPKIGASDFDVKKKRVVKFLRQGDKVKCTMRFRGREVAHPELGRDILQRLFNGVEDYAEIETMPRLDGRNMTMVLVPVHDMPPDPKTLEDRPDDVEANDAAAVAVVAGASDEVAVAPEDAPAVEVVEDKDADSADSVDSDDSTDSADSVDSDDSTESE
jgi:translation initiation factor IF-3